MTRRMPMNHLPSVVKDRVLGKWMSLRRLILRRARVPLLKNFP